MHILLSLTLPLALIGNAIANPLLRRDDACLAAVTGSAALGDPAIRLEHCSSYMTTIVTPAATTVTATITDAPQVNTAWQGWKREVDERDVTVCPNQVPNYASACDDAGYKSACNAWGISGETTYTIPADTVTKTVYVGGYCTSTAVVTSIASACAGGPTTATVTATSSTTSFVGPGTVATSITTSTVTAISTTTLSAVTVTVTVVPSTTTSTASTTSSLATTSAPAGSCLTAAQAQTFVDAFTNLLEYTSYNGSSAPPGRGYHYNVSAQYLAPNFMDYSDSINWMAGIPLTTVTFPSRAAFDYGQSAQPELTMTTLDVDFGCKTVHWRWSALTSSYANVRGINYMTISDDLTQIVTNYAEFNNADWIQSFAPYNPSISCVVPGGLTKAGKRSMPATY